MTAVSYCALADVKAALRIPSADTQDDTILQSLIAAASRKIDEFCGRYFGQTGTVGTPEVRDYQVSDDRVLIDDLVSCSDIGVDYVGDGATFTSLGASAVRLLPVNAAKQAPARPYTSLKAKPATALPVAPGWVRVTGVFGWPAVPDEVVEACLLQTVRLFKSRDVPLGLVGGADALGGMRLPRGLHPDAAELIRDYVHSARQV